MKLRVANEQREEALWGVFLMFVVMALIIVRTGVICRSLSAVLSPEEERLDAAPPIDGPPSPASADDLYQAVLAVLYLAEAAGRLLIVKTREVWELINEPSTRPMREHPLAVAGSCEPRVPLLDTS